ncbi:hypothetical protein [Clostridium felsineum]|uniref:hypothetical protein n=1 Tax=Clostridium felsineum TaxID=36839 RepID=UPI00098CB4F3|nr:hypothetical protein [Clostridium felsineum]URZ16908.1 hypothetical protein CLFE_029550 [Clostridium felsineum DSM 794]
MLDIRVNEEQILYVKELLKTANFGRRPNGDFNGTHDMQLVGILSQTVVADLLKVARPVDNGKSDGGVDFILNGQTIDLKSMTRHVPMRDDFVHNLYGGQAHFNTDLLLFSSYNKTTNVLTVCGYIAKADFLKKAQFYKEGTVRKMGKDKEFKVRGKQGNYEISQAELLPINTVEELFNIGVTTV